MNQRPTRPVVLLPGYGPQRCPGCGSSRGFRTVTVQDNSTGLLMFFSGGIIPYLLYESNRANLLACDRCGSVFQASQPTDWRFILITLGVAVGILAIGLLSLFWSS